MNGINSAQTFRNGSSAKWNTNGGPKVFVENKNGGNFMKKSVSWFIAVALLVVTVQLSGCATPAALNLKEHASHFQPPANSEKGYIYFYRESSMLGAARGIYLVVDGNRVGGVNSGTYFVYEAVPGSHWIAAENSIEGVEKTKKSLNVAAGKEYFVRTTINFGHPDAWGDIHRVGEEEGKEAIKSLKYATLNEK
jgi:hypothetical protein